MKLPRLWLLPSASLAALIGLAGCAPTNLSEESVASLSPSATPSASRVPSAFKIPEDFPGDVPVHEGELVLGSAAGNDSARTWAIEVLIQDTEKARKETLAELASAGFELVEETGAGTETYQATLTRFDYLVRLKIYLENETGEKEIRYVVTGNR